MGWSITGWSGGARQPVSYRLRAGQFRGMGTVRGYSNNIFVNNNYYNSGFSGYNYGYGCNCNSNNNSGTPKWMNWMMGLGMGTSLLGNILGMFGIGKDKDVEGKGGTEAKDKTDAQAEADKNCKKIKALYGDKVASVVYIDGEYNARLKDDTMLTATDSKTLIDKINEKIKATKPTQTTSTEGNEKAEELEETPDEGEGEASAQKPNLFAEGTLNSLDDSEAVLNKFKDLTNSDAVKIGDVKSNPNGITISLLVDKGLSNGDKSVSINLSNNILGQLDSPNKTVNLGNIAGKAAFAQNIDGYIKMNIGGQDYIIGQAKNNTYQGFQYENMNGNGYGTANWTNKTK